MLKTSKVLTLSTNHITPETKTLLDREAAKAAPDLEVYKKDCDGWFIYLDENNRHDLPTDLRTCLDLAKDVNASILCLDPDTPEVSYLTQYAISPEDTILLINERHLTPETLNLLKRESNYSIPNYANVKIETLQNNTRVTFNCDKWGQFVDIDGLPDDLLTVIHYAIKQKAHAIEFANSRLDAPTCSNLPLYW